MHGRCQHQFGKARCQFDTQSNNYTFAYVALLNSSEAARCGHCWRCSKAAVRHSPKPLVGWRKIEVHTRHWYVRWTPSANTSASSATVALNRDREVSCRGSAQDKTARRGCATHQSQAWRYLVVPQQKLLSSVKFGPHSLLISRGKGENRTSLSHRYQSSRDPPQGDGY